MKAIVQNGYGSPEVLRLAEVAKPAVKDGGVLVRVHASSINAGDYFSMRGSPWLIRFTIGLPRPKNYLLGWDVAGTVEAVGNGVTRLQPGDEVLVENGYTDEDILASYRLLYRELSAEAVRELIAKTRAPGRFG